MLRKRIKKTSLTILIASTMIISSQNVLAEQIKYEHDSNKTTIAEDVINITKLLESYFTTQYENEEIRFKNEVKNKNYNYALSMECFNDQGNPFKGYTEMNELIAALCVISENTDLFITDIQMLECDYKEDYITESIPVKHPVYKEIDSGKYIPDGSTYITKESILDNFLDEDYDGLYEKRGTITIKPQEDKIKYLLPAFKVLTPFALLDKYNLSDESKKKEYDEKLEIIKNGGKKDRELSQSILVEKALGADVLSSDAKKYLKEIDYNSLSDNQKALLYTSVSLIGKVPYLWNGKSRKAGYDEEWWGINEDGKQLGLDCSGYVQWIYRTAGFDEDIWKKIGSTYSILENEKQIPKSDIALGDLGLLHDNNGKINHVGMYIGDGYYIHCSSGAKTVTIGKGDSIGFKIFVKVE